MKKPLYYKFDLPIFVEKSASKVRGDKYEHYYPTILRNLLIHCGDQLWEKYPFQPILDFVNSNLPPDSLNILEVGCGVGRIISEVAGRNPQSSCFGVDYSLQMLKFAHKIWVKGEKIEIDGRDMGFPELLNHGRQLSNLRFAMADIKNLPWKDKEIDVVITSFLLDKLADTETALKEIYRVLTESGRFLMVTPFNIEKRQQWDKIYPIENFLLRITSARFKMVKAEHFRVIEPIDRHGNSIHWKCAAFIFKKQ